MYWLFNIIGIISSVIFVLVYNGSYKLVESALLIRCIVFLLSLYIIGSKGMIVLEEYLYGHISTFDQSLEVFTTYHGRWYGSLLAVVLVYLLARSSTTGTDTDKIFEIVMLGTCVGIVFGKLGCFFSGHYGCHGVETNLPWGVTYPYGINLDAPVHPIQLYDAFFHLLLFGLLIAVKQMKVRLGLLFLFTTSLYSFSISFLRSGDTFALGLKLSQVIYLIILIISLVQLSKRRLFLYS